MTTYANFNANLIQELRARQGKVDSGPFAGRPLVILTTQGAKSGATREHPLVYTRDGDDYVIIASKGGADTNPAWFHNLRAHPKVTLEVDGERFEAEARVAEGEERDRLYAAQAAIMPGFAEYQRKTSRQIPVIVLKRTP